MELPRYDGHLSIWAARLELLRLKREVKRLRMERDILKKAAAWFARESDSIPSGGTRS